MSAHGYPALAWLRRSLAGLDGLLRALATHAAHDERAPIAEPPPSLPRATGRLTALGSRLPPHLPDLRERVTTVRGRADTRTTVALKRAG